MYVCLDKSRWFFCISVAKSWTVVEACEGAAGDRDDGPGMFADLVLEVGKSAHFEYDGFR